MGEGDTVGTLYVPPEFKGYSFSKREMKLQYAGGCCLVHRA